MKKTFLLLMTVAALFASCRGAQGPAGKDGRDGIDGLVNVKIVDLSVSGNQWQYSGYDNNNYFMGTFDMPEITQDIYDNGLVQVYREYDTGTANAVQLLLPNTRHKEYSYTDTEGNTQWGFYSETTDYEYGVGKLNVFFTASDFDYEIDTSFVPEDMRFRVVIMW